MPPLECPRELSGCPRLNFNIILIDLPQGDFKMNSNFGQKCKYSSIFCQERSGCSGCCIYLERDIELQYLIRNSTPGFYDDLIKERK